MPSARPSARRRVERREVRAARRARRFALLAVLALVLVVSLALTAFGGGAKQQLVDPFATRTLVAVQAQKQTKPFPEIVAIRGAVRLQLPIAQSAVTAIGYHSASDGALALAPSGHQGNEGLVQRVLHAVFGGADAHPTWYSLGGSTTSALDVGGAVGTDVYSPVDGTVVGITPYIVDGKQFGSRIDIQPQNAPSLVVSLTQLRADPSLTVGSSVISGATQIGTIVDLALVERQALARYTNDAGNHVTVELRPAGALLD